MSKKSRQLQSIQVPNEVDWESRKPSQAPGTGYQTEIASIDFDITPEEYHNPPKGITYSVAGMSGAPRANVGPLSRASEFSTATAVNKVAGETTEAQPELGDFGAPYPVAGISHATSGSEERDDEGKLTNPVAIDTERMTERPTERRVITLPDDGGRPVVPASQNIGLWSNRADRTLRQMMGSRQHAEARRARALERESAGQLGPQTPSLSEINAELAAGRMTLEEAQPHLRRTMGLLKPASAVAASDVVRGKAEDKAEGAIQAEKNLITAGMNTAGRLSAEEGVETHFHPANASGTSWMIGRRHPSSNRVIWANNLASTAFSEKNPVVASAAGVPIRAEDISEDQVQAMNNMAQMARTAPAYKSQTAGTGTSSHRFLEETPSASLGEIIEGHKATGRAVQVIHHPVHGSIAVDDSSGQILGVAGHKKNVRPDLNALQDEVRNIRASKTPEAGIDVPGHLRPGGMHVEGEIGNVHNSMAQIQAHLDEAYKDSGLDLGNLRSTEVMDAIKSIAKDRGGRTPSFRAMSGMSSNDTLNALVRSVAAARKRETNPDQRSTHSWIQHSEDERDVTPGPQVRTAPRVAGDDETLFNPILNEKSPTLKVDTPEHALIDAVAREIHDRRTNRGGRGKKERPVKTPDKNAPAVEREWREKEGIPAPSTAAPTTDVALTRERRPHPATAGIVSEVTAAPGEMVVGAAVSKVGTGKRKSKLSQLVNPQFESTEEPKG